MPFTQYSILERKEKNVFILRAVVQSKQIIHLYQIKEISPTMQERSPSYKVKLAVKKAKEILIGSFNRYELTRSIQSIHSERSVTDNKNKTFLICYKSLSFLLFLYLCFHFVDYSVEKIAEHLITKQIVLLLDYITIVVCDCISRYFS